MATRWVTYHFMDDNGASLPKAPGVYVIRAGRMPIYIGQSLNVYNRFLTGHKFRYGYAQNIHTPWASISDLIELTVKVKTPKRHGDWAMDEIRLIARLRPRFNVQHVNRRRAA